jgi:hypothetical protein
MDITFTSTNKSIIKRIVTYFVNAKITCKNVGHHINVIRSRYEDLSTRVVSTGNEKGNQLKMKITIVKCCE